MHGIKKRVLSDVELKEQHDAISSFRHNMDTFIANRHTLDETTFKLTTPILVFNPEVYTAWNYRREFLLSLIDTSFPPNFTAELSLTQQCISKNPKLYAVWNHRRWVISHMPDPPLQAELALCHKLHLLDDRNFHCWNYRRFLCSECKKRLLPCGSDLEEFQYTQALAEKNISNYSTWHQRLTLRSKIKETGSKIPTILEEFLWVKDAVYCDPDDESAWLYIRSLIQQLPLTSVDFDCKVSVGRVNNVEFFLVNSRILIGKVECDLIGDLIVECVNQSNNSKVIEFENSNSFAFSIGQNFVYVTDICPKISKGDHLRITVNGESKNFEINEAHQSVLDVDYDPNCELYYVSMAVISDILQLEPLSKWTLLSKAILNEFWHEKYQNFDVKVVHQSLIEIYKQLAEIDPKRNGFYQYKLARLGYK
ncbi:hypothetical protein P9112_000257 [Eukaryota sp. TZLM1-RC]